MKNAKMNDFDTKEVRKFFQIPFYKIGQKVMENPKLNDFDTREVRKCCQTLKWLWQNWKIKECFQRGQKVLPDLIIVLTKLKGQKVLPDPILRKCQKVMENAKMNDFDMKLKVVRKCYKTLKWF